MPRCFEPPQHGSGIAAVRAAARPGDEGVGEGKPIQIARQWLQTVGTWTTRSFAYAQDDGAAQPSAFRTNLLLSRNRLAAVIRVSSGNDLQAPRSEEHTS